MGLQHKPEKAACIITACAALHNFSCLMKEPQPPVTTAALNTTTTAAARRPLYLPPVDDLIDSTSGMQARQLLIQKSFT
ncbi:hypothetical protein V5799_000591 [Amblyomma americanum]|uniref:Uncharacterized protein n=1 Tax=Amblyomma americanum TaxID=6943 RepID=A0AAQ4D2L5_AMBAM